jgi:hypothetical protein
MPVIPLVSSDEKHNCEHEPQPKRGLYTKQNNFLEINVTFTAALANTNRNVNIGPCEEPLYPSVCWPQIAYLRKYTEYK